MNIGSEGWFPVYLEPTLEEMQKLASNQWDTLRVLVVDSTKELCVASGYGNTHSSMVHCLQRYKNTKRVYTEDYIVYHESNIAFVNDSYAGSGDKIPHRKWTRLFEPQHLNVIEVLCLDRGLQLT